MSCADFFFSNKSFNLGKNKLFEGKSLAYEIVSIFNICHLVSSSKSYLLSFFKNQTILLDWMLSEDLLCDLEEIRHFLRRLVSRSIKNGLTLQCCIYFPIVGKSLVKLVWQASCVCLQVIQVQEVISKMELTWEWLGSLESYYIPLLLNMYFEIWFSILGRNWFYDTINFIPKQSPCYI